MALPAYFGRNAVAIAQAISGLDEQRLAALLEPVRVGITIGAGARNSEGRALTDLLVRLLARLYPTLMVRSERGDADAAEAQQLAARINPLIEASGTPTVEIVVGGSRLTPWAPVRIMAGSSGWVATVSSSHPQACGDGNNPFGAGAAACFAAANLFRHVFLPDPRLDTDATFNVFEPGTPGARATMLKGEAGSIVLAGAGAIGNAAGWAFARTEMSGHLVVVDPEQLDLGNLQRYVLAEYSDVNASKPDILKRYFGAAFTAETFNLDIASFISAQKEPISSLLLALDTARDRRLAQAGLPAWIANAWTQAGDLGVSTHDFLNGACVRCLYLPEKALANEDALIADAFGVPQRLMEVRTLLYRNEGVPRALLEAIASAHEIALERLLPFEGRPVGSLYREGFCGGAVIPLASVGTPRSDVHVPLAHQSALAGVLLAAAAVRHRLSPNEKSEITQIDVLGRMPLSPTKPAAKGARGLCICQDEDYREAYRIKFHVGATIAPSEESPRQQRLEQPKKRAASRRNSRATGRPRSPSRIHKVAQKR